MADGMGVSYPQDIRERASYGLACIDIYPLEGTRMTIKGPASRQDLDELREFLIAWTARSHRRFLAKERKRRSRYRGRRDLA